MPWFGCVVRRVSSWHACPPFKAFLANHGYIGSVILSGLFQVILFFVLSGMVLALGPLKKQQPQTAIKGMLKRYVRLGLPVLVTSALYYSNA
jgi:peptidoglycan/LPS O-acetylase OafA/YrhL